MNKVKIDTLSVGQQFHFSDDPNSRSYKISAIREDIVFYQALPLPDDRPDLAWGTDKYDWTSDDIEVYFEPNENNF